MDWAIWTDKMAPQESPDLTPFDFYLWGALKTHVYSVNIENRLQLEQRIHDAFTRVRGTEEVLRSVRSVRRRSLLCLQSEGGTFEQLL